VNCHAPHSITDVSAEYGPAIKSLGRGAYGNVELHHSAEHGDVAVKSMRQRDVYSTNQLQPDMIREISALTALDPHPDIIQMIDWSLPNYNTKTGDKSVKIVLEAGEESLSDVIKKNLLGSDTVETKMVLFQLLRGTAYMNSKDIWHRDLKPGNVILKQIKPYPDVKIADFGLSRAGPYCYVTPTEVMYTLWYRPPEILLREVLKNKAIGADYTEKAEVWALGIIFWDLLVASRAKITRYHLRAKDVNAQLYKILRALGVPTTKEETPFGWEPRRMIRRLSNLFREFNTINETNKENLFYMSGLKSKKSDTWDLLSRMLELNAERRLSVYEALNHPYFDGVREWIIEQDNAPILKDPGKCFGDMMTQQQVENTPRCLDVLPGDTEEEKLHSYAKVTAVLLTFTPTQNKGDVGTFPLGIMLFLCALGTPGVTAKDYHALGTLGLSCMSLAGKYYARKPYGVGAVAHSLGDVYTEPHIAQYEGLLFRIVGGLLHLPTSYRMLIALIGCPVDPATTPLQQIHASIFAWAVGLLCLLLTTKVAFAGTPAEIAMLAAQLSTHFHNKFDISRLPGCCGADSENRLCIKALVYGAKIAHQSFGSMSDKVQAVLAKNVEDIVTSLSPFPVPSLTPAALLLILEGKETIALTVTTEEEEEESLPKPLVIQAQKRKKKKTSWSAKGADPMLSPELTFSPAPLQHKKLPPRYFHN
jgi:serine/threonine protein kinase